MNIECERGSISVFWLISILVVLELILFVGTKVYEDSTISLKEYDFLEKKLELEDLEEQAKLVGYALMEKSIEESINYIDSLDGLEFMSREKLENIYTQRVEHYMSRNINVFGRAKSRDIAYIEGFTERFEREYGYRSKSEYLSAEATRQECDQEDAYRKTYEVIYTLKDEKDEVGYVGTPIFLVLEYPLYSDISSENVASIKVEVQKKSL